MRIVVDLDGTLCRRNTFRLWTVSAFLRPNAVNRGSYLASAAIFFVLYTLRLLRALNHWQMKRLFVVFWGIAQQRRGNATAAQQFNRSFAESICRNKLNQHVVDRIRQMRSGVGDGEIALATAAPAFYASHIARWLNATSLASVIDDEQLANDPFCSWFENVREAKRDRVVEWLAGDSYFLFTDHEDDWPLIAGAEKVFLVSPGKQLLARIGQTNTPWEIVR